MTDLSSLLLPSDYVTLRMALVDEVGFDAAVLLERVRWRCEMRPEGWTATYAEIGEQTRLSHRRVKAAVQVLRERGWLVSTNAGEGSRTLRWQVVLDPSGRNEPMGIGPKRPDQSAETARSSYIENTKEEHVPALRAVPDVPEPDKNDRPDIQRLCEHLADRIEANGSKRPSITKAWHDACRLLIDRDNRTPDQILKAIDWSQTHHFWHTTILSMPKLRKQYDQMRLQAQAEARQSVAPRTDPFATPTDPAYRPAPKRDLYG